jgi:hypothetical protein
MLKEALKELGLEIADHWKTKAVIRGGEHIHNYYTFKIGKEYWCASEAPIINNQYSYVLSSESNPFFTKYAGYELDELKAILKEIIAREEKTC